jgi:hypothetical protein
VQPHMLAQPRGYAFTANFERPARRNERSGRADEILGGDGDALDGAGSVMVGGLARQPISRMLLAILTIPAGLYSPVTMAAGPRDAASASGLRARAA